MKPYTINKSTTKIILAVVLVAVVLGLFFFLINNTPKDTEKFISPGELKARSAAMPPAPDKICEQPGNIKFVGQNYSVCCPNSPQTHNCLCQLPGIKTCQQQYSDCLAGKVFSKASRDFLGEENMPDTCQKLMDGCAGGAALDKASPDNQLAGMKPDLSNPGNYICSIDRYKPDNLAVFCGQICQQFPGCRYYQTDNLTGNCGLYKGQPVPLEKGAQASSSGGNYKLFSAKGKEGFTDTLGPAGQFCLSGAINNCSKKGTGSSTANCLCSHSVVKDCQTLYQGCLKTSTNPENCRAQFGSCCSLVDTANPSANASMSADAKTGNGRQNDILCTRPEITSLTNCKSACLRLDTCDFINTNLQDASGNTGSSRTGLTNDGLAPYCQLFKGQPLNTPGVMLGQQTNAGKTIYMKLRGNPDEREINAEFAKK